MAVEMQDLWNVNGRLGHPPGLLAPCQILAVVRLTELAMRHAGSAPCVDVPRISDRDAARIEILIALPQLKIDHAFFAVVGRRLHKRDDICTAGCGSQQLLDVVVLDVVIIIYKRDVLPPRDVEQCLALRADAALAVVTEDQVLDGLPADLSFDLLLEGLQLLLASWYRWGQYA